MDLIVMKANFPGLCVEPGRNGTKRYRVRVEGNRNKKINLHVQPDHREFSERYHAARSGIDMGQPEPTPNERAIKHSVSWLCSKYLERITQQVKAELASPLTLKKKKGLLDKFCAEYGRYEMTIPTEKLIEIQHGMADRPASADSLIETIRAMYRWACSTSLMDQNTAMGIKKIDRGRGGATPWTVENIRQYTKHHMEGTTAHLCMMLLLFTSCRIGDAIHLGRKNEFTRGGIHAIGWQPKKKGSKYVEVPMMPPLYNATRSSNVIGISETYLLNAWGQRFATPDSLGQMFRRWCNQAGLKGLSAHGVRKAGGKLLAEFGCAEFEIMSVHGHTSAKSSKVYTEGAERWKLALSAMEKMRNIQL